MSFGKLLATFGYPNGDPGRPKMAQKTSKSGFVDISKTLVFIRENMVFGGLVRHPEASGRHPGGIWRLPGSIWRLLEASGRPR